MILGTEICESWCQHTCVTTRSQSQTVNTWTELTVELQVFKRIASRYRCIVTQYGVRTPLPRKNPQQLPRTLRSLPNTGASLPDWGSCEVIPFCVLHEAYNHWRFFSLLPSRKKPEHASITSQVAICSHIPPMSFSSCACPEAKHHIKRRTTAYTINSDFQLKTRQHPKIVLDTSRKVNMKPYENPIKIPVPFPCRYLLNTHSAIYFRAKTSPQQVLAQ